MTRQFTVHIDCGHSVNVLVEALRLAAANPRCFEPQIVEYYKNVLLKKARRHEKRLFKKYNR